MMDPMRSISAKPILTMMVCDLAPAWRKALLRMPLVSNSKISCGIIVSSIGRSWFKSVVSTFVAYPLYDAFRDKVGKEEGI
jgi:hypothetical protein